MCLQFGIYVTEGILLQENGRQQVVKRPNSCQSYIYVVTGSVAKFAYKNRTDTKL